MPDVEKAKNKGGAPMGNTNAATGKRVRDSFNRVIAKHGAKIKGNDTAFQKGLDALCTKAFKKALEGDNKATDTVFDRVEGKAHQSIDIEDRQSPSELLDLISEDEEIFEQIE